MTEIEIIAYLKENRKNGVAFGFMPTEVQEWCKEHRDETIFHVFSDTWRTLKSTILCKPATVCCLSEDYELKPQFKPHFEEFDIDKNGYFYYEGKQYYYRDDVAFEKRNCDTFKGFGGWLYKCNDGPVWTTIPHIAYEGKLYMYLSLDGNEHEITAPIPTKIRFMRYRE